VEYVAKLNNVCNMRWARDRRARVN
jgi:hypothetical protein